MIYNKNRLDFLLTHCILVSDAIAKEPKPDDSQAIAEQVKFLAEVIWQETRAKST